MKKLAIILSLSTLCYAANGMNQSPQDGLTPTQTQPKTTSDCSHLSDQEQQFATQLSDMHRTMFCRHFSVAQRIEAMTLASPMVEKLTGQKVTITPDEAVENVMKTARQNHGNSSNTQQAQPQQQQNPYNNYGSPNKESSNPYSNY